MGSQALPTFQLPFEAYPDAMSRLQCKVANEEAIASELEHLISTRERLKNTLVVTEDGVRVKSGTKRQRDRVLETGDSASSDAKPVRDKVQVIICSRTFSQLNQYVKEFRKLGPLGESLKVGMATGRSHACINSAVRSRCSSNEDFNEECLSTECDFRQDVNPLSEASTCFPMDLEDLRAVGTALCSCPYYATSKNIPECDIILAPYVSVFNKCIRQAMGLKTDGNILIIDEAHNIVSAVAEAQSSLISAKAMAALKTQAASYLDRFGSKLPEEQKFAISRVKNVADEQFQRLTKNAKSVVLMSGTLTPVEEFMRLSPFSLEPILHKSPPVFQADRFYASVLGAGSFKFNGTNAVADEQGEALVYDSTSRERNREMSALCKIVEHLSTVVPNGMVCFVSSYKFLNKFQSVFEQSAERVRVLKNKQIFFESRGSSDAVFTDYSREALDKGAILFAVYGGSQSEGVDFPDGLARLVLLVGLPYPPDSEKLQLRREYFRSRALQSDLNSHQRDIYAKLAKEMRTLLCYKTVNQSIGRAMRHKDDFAAVVLLDARYNDKAKHSLLPSYVRQSLEGCRHEITLKNPVESLMRNLKSFYQLHVNTN
ncbi:ATP-dependent DNA helicase CHL1 [Babesia sp. Xinjiang]|uniref:ATP-dependent DNA helicase CHL1 n=1 Tax=Babesia sp. Xinjiang TaxID=462227 RepID=UPI000A2177A1|nr:ATP-dependent DNA helicase CHL1 [Babesia sp. Xinjiang]ORM42306.1 ATP-dependent DNA helicase CHL1 [Babesia sp. Xinjiang]